MWPQGSQLASELWQEHPRAQEQTGGGGAVGSRASLNQEHFSPRWRRELACTSQRRVGGEGDGPPKGPEPQQKEKE